LAREYLFIIGNGFDLWHELATSYTEFYGLYADYLDAQKNYFPTHRYGEELWSCFESALGEFDESVLIEENDYMDFSGDDFPTQQLYGLEDAVLNFGEEFVKTITGHFTKWVKSINLTHAQIQIALPSGAQFISFNYTSTLQTVYQVPESNILHIHGVVAHNAGLVFGHSQAVMDSDRGEDTYYSDAINNGRQVLKDLKKPVDYVTANTLKPWLSNNNGFSKIIIIGHSLNEIDTPYFKTILNAFPNAYWECYSYSAHEASAHESKLLDIGVSQSLLKVGTYEKLLEAFPFE
jgi:hypothetical protein